MLRQYGGRLHGNDKPIAITSFSSVQQTEQEYEIQLAKQIVRINNNNKQRWPCNDYN